jgi:hypothetical protein
MRLECAGALHRASFPGSTGFANAAALLHSLVMRRSSEPVDMPILIGKASRTLTISGEIESMNMTVKRGCIGTAIGLSRPRCSRRRDDKWPTSF